MLDFFLREILWIRIPFSMSGKADHQLSRIGGTSLISLMGFYKMTFLRPNSEMSGDTRIAGDHTVNSWLDLRMEILTKPSDQSLWKSAYEMFYERISRRFLGPMEKILAGDNREGEVFAVCVIQCILIEFLEAFYLGKVYSLPKTPEEVENRVKRHGISEVELENLCQPNEYKSSASLFESFLTTHKPFKQFFDDKTAGEFYKTVRCGLLHEAATKDKSKIRGDSDKGIAKDTDDGLIVYRSALSKGIQEYLESYKAELMASDELKKGFLRKMDDVCQIRRCYYFAYGSNMDEAQLRKREVYVHETYEGHINGWQFKYNKNSTKEVSAKANIQKTGGEQHVYGLCLEIDKSAFKHLRVKYEIGYHVIEVPVLTGESSTLVFAKTFNSESLTDLPPTEEYRETIVRAAERLEFPEDYIRTYLG